MPYTLLKGSFVIRYPDLPRSGPEPDGDTVKFAPDTPALLEGLPRPSGKGPDLNARGVSVRLEAIDALETHFDEAHQQLSGANAARDALLARLGFTNVRFFADLPNKVESADQDKVRGWLLSNGVDANGRVIGFVYAGDDPRPDGAAVFLDNPLVDRSINAQLLSAGLVYAAYYATLPASLRAHLATASAASRAQQPPVGIWTGATADPDGAATVTDLAGLEQLVLWPKLFRRLVPYLATGAADLDGFDAWLRADPVNRDDRVLLLATNERGNLHDVIHASGHQIRMTAWPEDFVIDPDPAPPGGPTSSHTSTGAVVVVAALPDPVGDDRGHETVTLINTTTGTVTLDDWALHTTGGATPHRLKGSLPAGAVAQVTLDGVVRLGQRGDTITLTDADGTAVDRVSYKAGEVHTGRTICFGR
jgi:endonuclease YncB( thermonuclease family)